MFYTCRCGHCQRLAPVWDELGGLFKSTDLVQIIKVDCTVHSNTCTKQGVKGYPTLILFENGEPVTKYNGGRTLTDFVEFIKKHVDATDNEPQEEDSESDSPGKETEEEEMVIE